MLDNMAKVEARKEKINFSIHHDCQTHMRHLSTLAPSHFPVQYVPDEVVLGYKFSTYVIGPNRFSFQKVVRVFSLVIWFLKKVSRKFYEKLNKTPNFLAHNIGSFEIPSMFDYNKDMFLVTTGANCTSGLVVNVKESCIKLKYFFKKASDEVKHFVSESRYSNISQEVNEILYYSGPILPTQGITGSLTLCDTVTQTQFVTSQKKRFALF